MPVRLRWKGNQQAQGLCDRALRKLRRAAKARARAKSPKKKGASALPAAGPPGALWPDEVTVHPDFRGELGRQAYRHLGAIWSPAP